MDVFWLAIFLLWKEAAGKFPLGLNLTASSENVILSCSSSTEQLVRLDTTLTINGQDIGGFERGVLNDEQTTLSFVTFEMFSQNDGRTAQCHFNDNMHSDPIVFNIANVIIEFLINCDEPMYDMEMDLLTVTCNITGSGVFILRVDGEPFMNITDPTENSLTYSILEVSQTLFNQLDCVMIQCTNEEIGSNPLIVKLPSTTTTAATSATTDPATVSSSTTTNTTTNTTTGFSSGAIAGITCAAVAAVGAAAGVAVAIPAGISHRNKQKKEGKHPDGSVAVAPIKPPPEAEPASEMKDLEAASS